MEASIAKVEQARSNRRSNSIFDFDVGGHISDDAMGKYRAEVSDYLIAYESRLRDKRAFEALSARSRKVIFAFTNNRAGLPAEGVRVFIHVPDDVQVFDSSDFPDDPGMPRRPRPPRSGLLTAISALNLGIDAPSFLPIGALPRTRPPRNVSSPTIRPGASTEIEFTVREILHNVPEDSREDPVVLVFPRAATWTIPYEIHARNLPHPKRGELTITTTVNVPTVATAKDA